MLDAQLPVLAVAVHCHWHADHSKIVPRLTDCTSDKKGKVFPYWLLSVGPGADPGVQAVSPQVTEVNHAIDPAVGCRYFLPCLRLPA